MKFFILLFIALQSSLLFARNYSCPNDKTYTVFLTFDDGPHLTLTPKVLDILKQRNIKATFFLVGDRINSKTIPIIDRTIADGHTIGNHTYHHINHNYLSKQEILKNISKPIEIWPEYFESGLIRLPYGAGWFGRGTKHKTIMNIISQLGLRHVGWHVDSEDWNPSKRPTILPHMMKEICKTGGGVILFHDIQPNTIDHLDQWIGAIIEAGHIISSDPVPTDFSPDATYGK